MEAWHYQRNSESKSQINTILGESGHLQHCDNNYSALKDTMYVRVSLPTPSTAGNYRAIQSTDIPAINLGIPVPQLPQQMHV